MRQMQHSRPTPPPQRTLKTLAWTRLPISPWARPRSLLAGQLGLLCPRVKIRAWEDRRTPSSLLSVTPPPSVALTLRATPPVSGPSPCPAPPAPPRTRTPPPASRASPSRSRRPSWSRRRGATDTPPLRTHSSPPSRGPSPWKPPASPTPGYTLPHPARLRKAEPRRCAAIPSPRPSPMPRKRHLPPPPPLPPPPTEKSGRGDETGASPLPFPAMTRLR